MQLNDGAIRPASECVRCFTLRFLENKETETTFTNGCCYWFAAILKERFQDLNPEIMYAPIDNHFGTRIQDIVYDITGDVTNTYKWVPFAAFDDPLEKERIIRDCILF